MKPRDIDALARLLDGDLEPAGATANARALEGLATALQSSAQRPQMAGKADLRATLIEAARAQAPRPSLLARMRGSLDDATARWRYSMRVAAATGASAMVLSSGGAALAADRSLPSDPFYGIKLVLEDARVALIDDEVDRGRQLLLYAQRRLAEAETVAADGDMSGVARALAEADESSRAAAAYIIRAAQDRGQPELMSLLSEFARLQEQRLNVLLPLLSGDAALAAEDALVALRRIGQRVTVLSGPCLDCGAEVAAGDDGGSGGDGGAVAEAAADPDFDFSVIPHASEPFAPCPCVTDAPADTGSQAAGKAGKRARKGRQTGGKDSKPAQTTRPSDTGDEPKGDDPGTGGDDPPPADDPVGLPGPAKDATDTVDDVVKDVIGDPPPPPSPGPVPIPTPTTSGTLP